MEEVEQGFQNIVMQKLVGYALNAAAAAQRNAAADYTHSKARRLAALGGVKERTKRRGLGRRPGRIQETHFLRPPVRRCEMREAPFFIFMAMLVSFLTSLYTSSMPRCLA